MLLKRWHDIDWCDKNIVATRMSDKELLKALRKVHCYSVAVHSLLVEASRRGLAEAAKSARRYADHVDPEVSIDAADLLGEFGNESDGDRLLELAPTAVDQYHLAALLESAAKLKPEAAGQALQPAYESGSEYAVASVVSALPGSDERVESLILETAANRRLAPGTRLKLFKRLAQLPMTQKIEGFLVAFCIDDEGTDPYLTAVVDGLLSSIKPSGKL